MKRCPWCHEESAARRGGLCGACRSWWYRVSDFSPREIARYAESFNMRLHRMEARRSRIHAQPRLKLAASR